MSSAETLEVPVEVLVKVKIDVSPGLRDLLIEAGWTPPPSGDFRDAVAS